MEGSTAIDDEMVPENTAELATRFVDIAGMPWEKTRFPGIEMKLLYSDPSTGMSTMLFKMAPGAEVPLHEHTAVEQTYMISGRLVDHEGEVTAGSFCWRPGGNRHIARAPDGAVFLSVFLKPNRYASGVKFFTE
jgi:anti-sigma factor ChrR (cupin superfamily)